MPDGEWNEATLRAEADYFHRALFRSPVPAAVADRYVRLHAVCFRSPNQAERTATETVVRRQLDAEAIECALRLRRRNHLLTQKFHALLYLVEVRREYYSLFFNDVAAPVEGKVRLIAAVLAGAWKTLVGVFLIRRHRLD